MGLRAQADLIVAAADLSLVRMLRGAIRTADIHGGKFGPGARRAVLGMNPRVEPRQVIHPSPRVEPRDVFHPTPRFAPRTVIYPSPRLAACADRVGPTCCEAPPKPAGPNPLPPPWKIPVWEMPLPPATVIKVHIHRVDVQNKGSLIDFFL